VALDDVSHLVSEHARELVLAVREHQEPAGDVDPAARQREGIRPGIVRHAGLPGDVRTAGCLAQPVTDGLDVFDEARVAHETHGALDLVGFGTADLALFARRHAADGGKSTEQRDDARAPLTSGQH
jgi:hypothetical protein